MTGSRTRMAVGSILLSFVLAIVIGVSGVIAPGGGAALGASTSLTILSGDVQVSHAGAPFASAVDGAVLGPGDVIRTAADARAVLTYFEGSTVSIEPSSELAIQEASASPDGSTVVVMTQNLGRTWHVVTKLITGGSRYEVRTPAATASVRGTAFEVGVVRDASGATQTDIVTTEGAVAAAAPATAADPQPEPVLVPAGFQTMTKSTERMPAPPVLAPAPERSVSVTVGSSNSLVVDPLGRANGMKDGKLVIQTPGATVTMLAGTLQITLPNVPDGKLATFVERGGGRPDLDVPVITTVQERGKPTTLARDTVEAGAKVSGLEVKRNDADGAAPSLRRVESDSEKNELKAPKARVEGPAQSGPATVFRPGLGGDPQVIARIAEERRADAQRATDDEQGGGRLSEDKDKDKKDRQEQGGFVPTLPFQAAPAAERQMEERRTGAQNETDAAAADQMRKAAEAAQRAAEIAQASARAGQQQANNARAIAEEQARRAEEEKKAAERRAAEATDGAKKREAEDAAKKAAADQSAAAERQRKAEADGKAKADAAAKAEQAKKIAEELERKAREVAERLRGGGGNNNSGGGNNNSGGGNNRNR